MDRLILHFLVSTDSMRTCTSWPTETSSSTSSTKPSLSWVACTMPSVEVPSSAEIFTKAPNGKIFVTVPVSHRLLDISKKGVRSWACSLTLLIDKAILPEFTFADSTLTFTCWPTDTSSSTCCCTKPSLSSAIRTKPSAKAPSSSVTVTNAPKEAVFTTTPSNQSVGDSLSKGARSAGRLPIPPKRVLPFTMVRASEPSSLLASIQASTSWPTCK
mmetsp:Transcript_6340/g.11335  ORF Transcript_6340/g.11335 Transcript_6340/m.11335 type:complete len:215 (-) Transcript_6340:199-843(-)